MSMARVRKAAPKYISGRRINNCQIPSRNRYGNKFVTVVFRIGIVLVFTFLLWTLAMVLLQALEQWQKR
jgi:hypothetical protein